MILYVTVLVNVSQFRCMIRTHPCETSYPWLLQQLAIHPDSTTARIEQVPTCGVLLYYVVLLHFKFVFRRKNYVANHLYSSAIFALRETRCSGNIKCCAAGSCWRVACDIPLHAQHSSPCARLLVFEICTIVNSPKKTINDSYSDHFLTFGNLRLWRCHWRITGRPNRYPPSFPHATIVHRMQCFADECNEEETSCHHFPIRWSELHSVGCICYSMPANACFAQLVLESNFEDDC